MSLGNMNTGIARRLAAVSRIGEELGKQADRISGKTRKIATKPAIRLEKILFNRLNIMKSR